MEQAGIRPSLPDDGESHLRQEPETAADRPPQVNGQPAGQPAGQPEDPEEVGRWETIVCPVYTMTRSTAALSFATVQWDTLDPSVGHGDAPRLDPMEEEEEEEVMAGLEDVPTLRPSKDVRRAPQEVAGRLDGFDAFATNGGDISGSCDAARSEERAMQEVEHPALWSSERVGEAIKSPGLEEEEVVPVRAVAAAPSAANAPPLPEEVVFCSGSEKPETTTASVYATAPTPGSGSGTRGPASSPPADSAEGEGDEDLCGEEHVCPGDAEARGEPIGGAGRATRTDGERADPGAECSNASARRSEVGAEDAREEPPELTATAETKPRQEWSEGLDSQGTADLAGGEDAAPPGVWENSKYWLEDSAEHLTPAGSRVTMARPSELNRQGSVDRPGRTGRAAEVDQPGKSQQGETSPEVQMDETERSEQRKEGDGLVVEFELGGGGGGATETRVGRVTETGTAGVSSNPPSLESVSEPDRTAELVWKLRIPEHCVAESEASPLATAAETESTSVERPMDQSQQTDEEAESSVDSGDLAASTATAAATVTNGDKSEEPAALQMNGGSVDHEKARRLAQRLYRLEEIQRVDVVKHMDKDNDFSRAVGAEFLSFFDFSGQTLDNALRSFLKEVVLIGESQERARVLQHFSARFHQCNPEVCSSPGAALTLTSAMMLLNTDLHGQNVGKAMSTSSFVSNMDGMNDGENFNKDLLKSFYNSIKGEPLQWAVDEEELKMLQDEDLKEDGGAMRSKSNPFQDVPHDKKAKVFKQGFLQRKAHADIDGKRTPWGKRSWKTFYGVLKGLVLYFQKDDYRKEMQGAEEVVSVHHALAEEAADYTKKPHVFRLQTADWRVFLFQASSKAEMSSWISRINLVAALHSSPPFPAAVGSQRRFTRPILPASQSAQTLERQLHSHAVMLESFEKDLSDLQQGAPEGRKPRAKDLEEMRLREQYLLHEKCRYEGYIAVLKAWGSLNLADGITVGDSELRHLDKAMFRNFLEDIEEESEGLALKKSISSPSLEFEMAPPVVKVRRNVSERRTYRRNVIARRNKDL